MRSPELGHPQRKKNNTPRRAATQINYRFAAWRHSLSLWLVFQLVGWRLRLIASASVREQISVYLLCRKILSGWRHMGGHELTQQITTARTTKSTDPVWVNQVVTNFDGLDEKLLAGTGLREPVGVLADGSDTQNRYEGNHKTTTETDG